MTPLDWFQNLADGLHDSEWDPPLDTLLPLLAAEQRAIDALLDPGDNHMTGDALRTLRATRDALYSRIEEVMNGTR